MKNWKKMLLSLTLSAGLLVTAMPVWAAPQQPAVKVNDQTVQFTVGAPMIDQGTTLVPLRSALDALNVKLTSAEDDTIQAVVNGKTITLKSKLKHINGVTYAPIRVIGDAAGYEVRWNADSRTVLLVSHGAVAVPKPSTDTSSETASETAQTGGRGFLWEVESNGNTVYLVGSMHIADDSFYPLRKEFEEAFAEADYLGVEIDLSKALDEEKQQQILKIGMYQDGTTLKDHVSAETYAKLEKVLKDNGMQPNALDAFKPWVVETTLSTLKSAHAGYEASSGVDLYFLQKAIERSLPVIELETYESQLGMFDSLSNELQEKNLNVALDNFDVLDETIGQMAEMWKTGNDEQLLELTNSLAKDEEYHKALLVDRNIEMANKIDGYLKNGNHEEYFIVVGAAHYPGEQGIVKLLEDKGYTVERK